MVMCSARDPREHICSMQVHGGYTAGCHSTPLLLLFTICIQSRIRVRVAYSSPDLVAAYILDNLVAGGYQTP